MLGAAPRIDAFRTLMDHGTSTSGTGFDPLRALLNVHDVSPSGDRRVILGVGNVPITDDTTTSNDIDPVTNQHYFTAGDGTVDMRVFRRFRDAFLEVCYQEEANGAALPPGCPNPASIVLSPTALTAVNGSDTNPKKDLNFDGCVFRGAAGQCPTPDYDYPRFDFNGDGHVDLSALQALKPLFGTDRSGGTVDTEGWTSANLDRLLVSGDLEVHADQFLAETGAASAQVTVQEVTPNASDPPVPPRTIASIGNSALFTAPGR